MVRLMPDELYRCKDQGWGGPVGEQSQLGLIETDIRQAEPDSKSSPSSVLCLQRSNSRKRSLPEVSARILAEPTT